MAICPSCRSQNIEGVDECQACGLPLNQLHLTPPTSEVERRLLDDRIGVLQPNPVVTVSPSTTVGEVLRLMVQRGFGCVVIAEGKRPVGIFSERDALNRLNINSDQLLAEPVSKFMTLQPETVVASAKVAYAVERMHVWGCRHLPIVDNDGELIGIISARDILKYLTAHLK